MNWRYLNKSLGWTISDIIFSLSKKRDVCQHVPVLCYHRILPDFLDDTGTVCSITPKLFESHMAFLANNGFISLTLEEYGELAKGHYPIPPRSILVTLDDGYADNYHIAWPIAQKFNIKINLFILTKFIGSLEPLLLCQNSWKVQQHITKFPELWRNLTWDELRIISGSGSAIGIHGHSHNKISTMELQEFSKEIAISIQIYKEQFRRAPKAYAIPYGNVRTFISSHLELLEQFRFEMIFSTFKGRTCLPCQSPPFGRLVMDQEDDIDIFQAKLFGSHDWIGLLRFNQQRIWEVLQSFS